MIKLFEVDPQTGEIEFANEDVLAVRELYRLWIKVFPVKGDSQGAKKLMNKAIFRYIKLVTNSTLYMGFDETEKQKRAAEDAGLYDLDPDWYPNVDIVEAVSKYTEMVEDYIPSTKLLLELLATTRFMALSVATYRTQLERLQKAIATWSDKNTEKDLDIEQMSKLEAGFDMVQKLMSNVMDVADRCPKTLDSLEKLYQKVIKETHAAKALKGGKQTGNREDPK
jgi:hypothetical protein